MIHNKSGKPDNIVSDENKIKTKCEEIEFELPACLREYFTFLKMSLSVKSRLAYLTDIRFFMEYWLLECQDRFKRPYQYISEITLSDLDQTRTKDLNYFLGEYCARYETIKNGHSVIFENNNRTIAKKKSTITSLFTFLYRNDLLNQNPSQDLNPIKMPKLDPDAIKKLDIEETELLIHVVTTGEGLSKKELQFWEKTKKRDIAIILLFITYGLRLSELQQLNISSFLFRRKEFRIYRKRGKESIMPLTGFIIETLQEYIEGERSLIPLQDDMSEDALFLSLQGKRITTRAIRSMVKKYTAIVMGSSRRNAYSPHKLRATVASSLIEQGFSIYDVQTLLDHDNVTTTQLYASHKKEAKKEIIDRFSWEPDTDQEIADTETWKNEQNKEDAE